MKKELPKAYEPSLYEDGIYKKWEESGFFNPDNLSGEPFSIMMPPPNVTGVLHLGHALENSLMDAMTRYQRMLGKKVLLLPGTDHAAVATQAKVEKLLVAEGIKNPRQELGRGKLLEKVREYAENSKSTILSQIRKIGTSCDWSRLAYTFDETRSQAVNEVFIKMYQDGLIFRGYRVINWSVKGQSTCSDDELVHVERAAKFYTFKYSKDFPITIATTRPETKLGDTAVAVNPADARYKKYIGKIFTAEIGAAEPLNIRIIADDKVDPLFGTGALGVTPAHSAVDFEMYEKQQAKNEPIDLIQVIDEQGKMTAAAGEAYAGLTVVEAREKFVSWLKDNGLLIKEEKISQNVGTSDRFGDVVEALPMTQWFVDVNKKITGKNKSLKELMREVVTSGHNSDPKQKITITPERFQKVYLNWIDNLRDWCISRQVWWGHRIPVWYCRGEDKGQCLPDCAKPILSVEKPDACPACGSSDLVQDEDTLDTWFSSGLWTFSTLGWSSFANAPASPAGGPEDKPDKLSDLQQFHPTDWMQMGYEILFFWMARMILMTTYALDQIPFKNVYIHGMLRDEKGSKFSKSSGNNIDPLEVIAKYGTDALRLSLLSGIAPGNDSKFYAEKVEGARNLVNKLWNISRFILSTVNEDILLNSADQVPETATLADKWVLDNLWSSTRTISGYLNGYEFSAAIEELHKFTLDIFADWYIEIAKFEKNKEEILIYILKNLLKLWQPFIPFVTENIWSQFGEGKMLIVSNWPKLETAKWAENSEQGVSGDFKLIQEIIIGIRNARSENRVAPAIKIKAVIYAGEQTEWIKSQEKIILSLRTGLSGLEVISAGEKIEKAIYAAVSGVEIYLIGGRDEAKELARLKKETDNLTALIKNTKNKLMNEEFVAKAPAAVIEKERAKLAGWELELSKLTDQLNN